MPSFTRTSFFAMLFFSGIAVWAQSMSISSSSLASFTTMHEGSFAGQQMQYKATAEETHLFNDEGEAVAALWSVAYTRIGVTNITKRPVTFVFNGGPGSASIWLHFGLFGPKLVKVDSEAKADDGAAPYQLADNPACLLDQTDLVFIDPIGTGYSRAIGKGKNKDFWGLNEDAASVAQFIRTWVSKHKRWMSPKYLAGESFGTTRAVAVTSALEGSGQHMSLNGLILISQALDYAGSTSTHDNIASYLTYLPSMAATAWYHKKAGQGTSLEDFVEEARQFTYAQYAPALYRGNTLTDKERSVIAEKLAYFTGLKQDYILRSELRILMPRFQKMLLAEKGLAIGRLDGRFMGDEADDVADRPTLGDPASYQISGAYTATVNHFYANELGVEMDRPYLTSNRNIGRMWRWRTVPDDQYWEPAPVNVARQLGDAMRRNTDLRILVANGYYDLITPFFDAEYTFARHGIVANRVEMKYYEGGHMMYTHEPAFVQLTADIRNYLKAQ